jgi:4-carboxymuconolactone decarboxylase
MWAMLSGDLWNRPNLSSRDRSMVMLAVLIARTSTLEAPSNLALASDRGVGSGKVSEIIAFAQG